MDLNEQAKFFWAETAEAFQFLEHQYDYQRLEGSTTSNPWTVISRYVGSHIGIQVVWNSHASTINVAFIELVQPGVFPPVSSFFPLTQDIDAAKAVYLSDLADMFGPGTNQDPDFLLQGNKHYWSPLHKKRLETIDKNMRGVLAGLARATETYASAILHGDTSMFPGVMHAHGKKHFAREEKRAAAIKKLADAWLARVTEHFEYLQTTYGFRITQVNASDWWVRRVIYQTATTAVSVDRSVEYNRVEVSLVRLLGGTLPRYPIFITPKTTLHQFSLDELLRVRAPQLLPELQAMHGLGDKQIETSLKFLAGAVNEHATDVLGGDLSIFATLEERVKQRALERPQTIRILSRDKPPQVTKVWPPEENPPEWLKGLIEQN